jgi:phage-related protein
LTDIVIFTTKTADSSQDTTFLSVNTGATTISWTSPQETGTYTVAVIGIIYNIHSNKVSTATLVLNVFSCLTTTDTLTITPSTITPQSVA